MPSSDLVVLGGGPAGLTCALEATRLGRRPLVLEKDPQVGGIARTESLSGFRFDLGGHRFFTRHAEIQTLWESLLGPDFLLRPRLSRIYYRRKFLDYPLKPFPTLRRLGWGASALVVGSYLAARLRPYPRPANFEQWVVNRFGRRLYQTFFRSYTEKVWGMPCTEISADWAAQRIRDLSLPEVLRAALSGNHGRHASLIEQFHYPRRGPGMLWERMAAAVTAAGGEVRLCAGVERLEHDSRRLTALSVAGERRELPGAVVSSVPLRDLVLSLSPAPPDEVLAAARALRYRGLLTVALLLEAPDLFPDNWIYLHEPAVAMGRVNGPRSFGREMAPDPARTCLGLEYFCWPGEGLWQRLDEELIALGERELTTLGLLHGERVLAGKVVRVPHAYPVYDPGYQERVALLRRYLAGFDNLQVIGRAGMHRYNNMDHSMLTGLLAARNLAGEQHDLWQVNLEEEYHEQT